MHYKFLWWCCWVGGVEIEFIGEGVGEKGLVKSISGANAPALKVGDVIIQVDPRYFRPAEVETLLGDPSNARNKLGWVPEITVQEMCAGMVKEDLILAKRTQFLKDNGYNIAVSSVV